MDFAQVIHAYQGLSRNQAGGFIVNQDLISFRDWERMCLGKTGRRCGLTPGALNRLKLSIERDLFNTGHCRRKTWGHCRGPISDVRKKLKERYWIEDDRGLLDED